MKTGQNGRDGIKLAAKLTGSLRFGVDHVHLRRAAIQVDVDDRSVGSSSLGGFGPEQLGQGERTDAQGARFEKASSTEAITVPRFH